MTRLPLLLATAAAIAAVAAPALAQSPPAPSFSYGKKSAVTQAIWKASVQAGLTQTTGNSDTTTLSGGAHLSRDDGTNRFTLDANGVFARSSILLVDDADGDGIIQPGEITTQRKVTAESWGVKPRVDHFFTEHNSGYLSGFVGADTVAGKKLLGGGQAGYSRQAYESASQELDLEIGYDFTYVAYEAAMTRSLAIHSARVFGGYTYDVTKDTSLSASVEGLFNVNRLEGPTGDVGPFGDPRVNGKAALTTTLWKNVSFRFAFTLTFDNVPAPLAFPGFTFAPGYLPVAHELDTLTEASLIVNLL